MWIGVLWAGLRVAMWITHVGRQISPWPARKVTDGTWLPMGLKTYAKHILGPAKTYILRGTRSRGPVQLNPRTVTDNRTIKYAP